MGDVRSGRAGGLPPRMGGGGGLGSPRLRLGPPRLVTGERGRIVGEDSLVVLAVRWIKAEKIVVEDAGAIIAADAVGVAVVDGIRASELGDPAMNVGHLAPRTP